jgi:hypothetical protein
MTNEELARELSGCEICKIPCEKTQEDSCRDFKLLLKMAEKKDAQPISEQGGWHKEKPKRDCWVILERIQGYYDVAYWENTSKHFYYPNEEMAKNWRRWKLL